MFTGIVQEMGEVVSLTPTDAGSAVLTVRAGSVLDGLPDGGSLAVNGVCLTQAPESSLEDNVPGDGAKVSTGATDADADADADAIFIAHVMGETLTRTTVGGLQSGDPVNLERCPRAIDRFDGHIVQGHVDGTGRVIERVDEGDWVRIRIAIPADLAPLTVEKGSIALDGVSLTLSAVSPPPASTPATQPIDIPATESPANWVEVGLIPATLAATRMGILQVGDAVNIEVDVIAKYAARLTQFHSSPATAPSPAAAPPVTATSLEGDLT